MNDIVLFAATALSSCVAAISGEAVIGTLLWVIVLGVVFWLLWWLIGYVGLPEPFKKIANVILAVAAVILLISILMNLAGRGFIKW